MFQSIRSFIICAAIFAFFAYSVVTEWNQVAGPYGFVLGLVAIGGLGAYAINALNNRFEWVLPAGCALAFIGVVIVPIRFFFF